MRKVLLAILVLLGCVITYVGVIFFSKMVAALLTRLWTGAR